MSLIQTNPPEGECSPDSHLNPMSKSDVLNRPLHDKLLPRFARTLANRAPADQGEDDAETFCHGLIQEASRAEASDIHIDPGPNHKYILRIRIDGALLDACHLEKAWADRLMNHFKVMARMNPLPAQSPMEGWVAYDSDPRKLNFRVSCVPTVSGDKMSLRLLDPARMRSDMGGLGLRDDQIRLIRSWIDDIQGMFLVVGAIGSGKTTTLYALLNELRDRPKNIVTIEDPVEFPVAGLTQIQVSREAELDFADALKSVARLDPDYIMVGELRDKVSAGLALEAASFGKVLMGTLHSRDAAGAITTLRNYGLKNFEIAAALEMVVAQRLVRTLCPHCRKKRPVAEADRMWAGKLGWEIPDELWYPQGCGHCKDIGFAGRTGVFEVWPLESESRTLLLEGKDEFALREAIAESGVRPLRHAAREMVLSGETSLEEVRVMGGFSGAD